MKAASSARLFSVGSQLSNQSFTERRATPPRVNRGPGGEPNSGRPAFRASRPSGLYIVRSNRSRWASHSGGATEGGRSPWRRRPLKLWWVSRKLRLFPADNKGHRIPRLYGDSVGKRFGQLCPTCE